MILNDTNKRIPVEYHWTNLNFNFLQGTACGHLLILILEEKKGKLIFIGILITLLLSSLILEFVCLNLCV